MPISKISNTLSPADWIKKAGPAEKTIGMATQLKDLTKQHEELQTQDLGSSGLSSVQDVQSRIQEIEGAFSKSVDAFAKKAKAVADAAKKAEAEMKKSNADVAKAAAAVAQAASAEAQEVAKAVPAALAALKALLGKLEAQEKKDKVAADKAAKKDEKEDEAEEDPAAEKDEKKFRDKVKSQLVSALKKVKGEGAPPAKFTVAVLGKVWGVYLGKSAGESEKKIAMRLAGLTSGFKHCKGITYWDPKGKCWVFEGPNIPVGRANATAMSMALKPIIGYAPRLRLQKPGERGEDMEGGEDDPDDKDQAVAQDAKAGGAGGPAGVEPIKAFTARLTALMPKVKASSNDQIKTAAAKAGELAGKGDAGKANALLDQIEKMLSSGAGAAGAAASAAAGAAGKLSIVQLSKARLEWATVRAEAVKGIEQLAQHIEREYRNEPEQSSQVQAACARLRALGSKLKVDLENQLDAALNAREDQREGHIRTVKATLTNVLQIVATDPLMKEIDGNELMPGLQVVKPMQARLRDIAQALG